MQKIELPATGEHLQQLGYALEWKLTTIPYLSLLIYPLQDLLENFYTKAGKRTKCAVSRINLIYSGCNDVQRRSIGACRDYLQQQMKLPHRDEAKRC